MHTIIINPCLSIQYSIYKTNQLFIYDYWVPVPGIFDKNINNWFCMLFVMFVLCGNLIMIIIDGLYVSIKLLNLLLRIV